MAIRRILLPLSGTEAGDAALRVAILAASRWQAGLTALHVRADGRELMALAGEGVSGAMIEQMIVAADRDAAARGAAAQASFHDAVARFGGGTIAAHFISETGRAEDVVAREARLADCSVLARPDAEGELGASDLLHAVLFVSGRPVLIAPPAPPATLGSRIALAWSGTAEAASAVWFGLPWMEAAEQVTILTASEYQRRGPDAAALAAYLALHGVRAEIEPFSATAEGVRTGEGVGAGLLRAAGAIGADLLVMGAYSSSRLRQLILGGATRHVIEHATLPVLMSR